MSEVLKVVSRVENIRSKKLQSSDRQMQISDRGNYKCTKFQFCPKWVDGHL